jgi:hypothetical protein
MPSQINRPAKDAVDALAEPLPFTADTVDLSQVQWQLGFAAPTSVDLSGSWPLGTSHKWKGSKGWTIDMSLQLPSVGLMH